MRSLPLILLALTISACRASGEGEADARPTVDSAATPDSAATIDAADPADADTTDADTTDADTTDAAIAEGAVINEFVFDSNGGMGSDMGEYIEVFADPDTDYSALDIVVLDGDVGPDGPGKVMRIYPVGTTNAQGFWETGTMTNQLQNGSQTLLLVQNFTGALNDDLDPGDDGTLDTQPWDALLDAVAVNDGAGTNVTYAGNAELAEAPGASRIPDGADSDMAADWVFSQPDTSPVTGLATYTPGAPNEVAPP